MIDYLYHERDDRFAAQEIEALKAQLFFKKSKGTTLECILRLKKWAT